MRLELARGKEAVSRRYAKMGIPAVLYTLTRSSPHVGESFFKTCRSSEKAGLILGGPQEEAIEAFIKLAVSFCVSRAPS